MDWFPIIASESVGEVEPTWSVDRVDAPPSPRSLTGRSGHEIARLTSDHEVVPGERGGECRWSPPPLQLAWILPDLPDVLWGGVEVGDDGEREALRILVRADDGHFGSPSLIVRMSVIWSTRWIQSCS